MFFSSFTDTLPGPNASKKHECPVCFKQFSKIDNMHLHLNVHKGNDKVEEIKAAREKKNRAASCKESSKFIKDAIEKLKALRCKDCKLNFSNKDLFDEHMKIHERQVPIPENNQSDTSSSEDFEESYKCKKCSETFQFENNLNRHCELNHSRTESNTENSKTIIFRPSEVAKNKYSKFIPRIITLDNGEKIIVQSSNDNRAISASNLVFAGPIVSNRHATFLLKDDILYLEDHSSNNTSITPTNGTTVEIGHSKSLVVNSFDTINFGACSSEGVITEIEILSDYEVQRLSNIEEKNQQIPSKFSSILPPNPKKPKKAIIEQDKSEEKAAKKTILTRQELRKQKESESLAKHLDKEINGNVLNQSENSCPECGESFETSGELSLHLEIMHPDYNLQSFHESLIQEQEMSPPSPGQQISSPMRLHLSSPPGQQLSSPTEEQMSSQQEQPILSPTQQRSNSPVSESSDVLEKNELEEMRMIVETRKPTIHTFLSTIVALIEERENWDKIQTTCESLSLHELDWQVYKRNEICFDAKMMQIDKYASSLYQKSGNMDLMPVKIECELSESMYAAMSVTLCGDPFLGLELKLSTVLAMSKHKAAIDYTARSKGFLDIDYSYEMLMAAKLNAIPTTINFISMAWAVKSASWLLYPQVGTGLTNPDFLVNQGLMGGGEFNPPYHYFMWSGENEKDGFSHTHIVPLLPGDEREVAGVQYDIEKEVIAQEVIEDNKVRFKNFGERIAKKKLYSSLESVKDEFMESSIPPGNKTNMTFFITRTNYQDGPGAVVDDKSPYSGKHGARVYAYEVQNNQFKKAISQDISTKNKSFTYKKDHQVHVCSGNWIILWQAYNNRPGSNDLNRSVTYFVTQNSDYLWLNKIALVEYTGIDDDLISSELPHGGSLYNGDPLRRVQKPLLREAVKLRQTGAPSRKIYNALRDVNNPTQGLANSKQVWNAVSYQKSKEFGPTMGNMANDQVLRVFRDMQKEESKFGKFVKDFHVDHRGKPSIVCFEEWQIAYTRKVGQFNPCRCAILEHDKTYNIWWVSATLFCFPFHLEYRIVASRSTS